VKRYVKATALLPDYILEELKKKTGEDTNKEALAKAIYHYVNCVNPEGMKKIKTGIRAVD
jgi:hypothetical protein